jgi:hypothetical protein
MPKPNLNLIDVEFIAEKAIWWAKARPEEIRARLEKQRMDALCSIPHPERGQLIIGQEANGRFWDIAQRFLDSSPEKKARTNPQEFVEKLRSEFSRRFLKDQRPIDQSNVDKMISTAYKAGEREFETAEHFIPSTLFFTNSVKSFAIGPVRFVHKSEFLQMHKTEFEELRGKIAQRNIAHAEELIAKGYKSLQVDPKNAAKVGNQLVDGMLDWFQEFNWVAVVTVPQCEAKVSYNRALFLVRGALNIVKLLLGPWQTDRLRTAEDRGHAVKAAKLKRVEGEWDISLSRTPKDNVTGDNWLERLQQESGNFFLTASRTLELSAGLDAAPPLCLRFLDALHWYGDAVAETAPAAKIVKFVTAIERVVGTGLEKDDKGNDRGVTEIVTTRAAIFFSRGFGVPFPEAKTEINRVYDSRSNLVHGSISPFADAVADEVSRTKKATRMILLVALDFFNSFGLENPALTEKELRRCYQDLERAFFATPQGENPPQEPSSP